LFDGHYHPEYGRLTAANPDIDRLQFLLFNLRHCHPVRTLPLFVLAALCFPWRRTRGALPALTLASLLGFVAIVWAFPLSDPWSIARYYSGFVVATVLAVSLSVCAVPVSQWWNERWLTRIPALLTIVAIFLQLGAVAGETSFNYLEFAARIAI